MRSRTIGVPVGGDLLPGSLAALVCAQQKKQEKVLKKAVFSKIYCKKAKKTAFFCFFVPEQRFLSGHLAHPTNQAGALLAWQGAVLSRPAKADCMGVGPTRLALGCFGRSRLAPGPGTALRACSAAEAWNDAFLSSRIFEFRI